MRDRWRECDRTDGLRTGRHAQFDSSGEGHRRGEAGGGRVCVCVCGGGGGCDYWSWRAV